MSAHLFHRQHASKIFYLILAMAATPVLCTSALADDQHDQHNQQNHPAAPPPSPPHPENIAPHPYVNQSPNGGAPQHNFTQTPGGGQQPHQFNPNQGQPSHQFTQSPGGGQPHPIGQDHPSYNGNHGTYGQNNHDYHNYHGPNDGHTFAHEQYAFRGHDVRHFDHDDFDRWRGGYWNNTCFAGRCGWWWLAGGIWYFYTQPIYPYPLIVPEITYVDPYAYEDDAPPPPPVYYAPPPAYYAPPPPPPVPLAPGPKFRYYCTNPPGYYPEVPNCNVQYQEVPAN